MSPDAMVGITRIAKYAVAASLGEKAFSHLFCQRLMRMDIALIPYPIVNQKIKTDLMIPHSCSYCGKNGDVIATYRHKISEGNYTDKSEVFCNWCMCEFRDKNPITQVFMELIVACS